MCCSYGMQRRRQSLYIPHHQHNSRVVSGILYAIIGHEPTTSLVRSQVGRYINYNGNDVKCVFTTGDGTDRRGMTALEIEKSLAEEEEFLEKTRKV